MASAKLRNARRAWRNRAHSEAKRNCGLADGGRPTQPPKGATEASGVACLSHSAAPFGLTFAHS